MLLRNMGAVNPVIETSCMRVSGNVRKHAA